MVLNTEVKTWIRFNPKDSLETGKTGKFSSNFLITSTQNNYTPDKGKIKGKHKRGERGAVKEEAQQSSKRANLAGAERQLTNVNNDETSSGANEKGIPPNNHAGETSLLE